MHIGSLRKVLVLLDKCGSTIAKDYNPFVNEGSVTNEENGLRKSMGLSRRAF